MYAFGPEQRSDASDGEEAGPGGLYVVYPSGRLRVVCRAYGYSSLRDPPVREHVNKVSS